MNILTRLFILSGLIIFNSPILKAQNQFKAGLHFALAGSQIDGDRMSGYNRPALGLGIFVNYTLSESQYLRADFKFQNKGANPSQYQRDNFGYESVSYNYIEVPFSYRHKIQKFEAFGGLGFAYLFSRYRFSNNERIKVDNADLKKFDFPLHLGVSYNINEKSSLSFQFQYSIISIRSGENLTPLTDNFLKPSIAGIYNNNVILSYNYLF